MKLLRVIRSPIATKKWRAEFDDGTHTDFGDSTMKDYTQHGDVERRKSYRARHRKDLETGDPRRAGYLSYYLLWGDSISLAANIRSYKKRFNM